MTKAVALANLDIYGNQPIPWSRATDQLDAVGAALEDKGSWPSSAHPAPGRRHGFSTW